MKIITRKYQVYKFKELNKDAKQKVIEKNYDINTDYEWFEGTIDYMTEQLEKLGFDNAKIGFSGFASQGDGANFTASVNLKVWAKKNKVKLSSLLLKAFANGEIGVSITQSGNYEHEMTMGTDINYFYNYTGYWAQEKIDSELAKIEDAILENAREEARKIYKILNGEYDDLTSEEAIKDTIELNEYTFLKNGDMFV